MAAWANIPKNIARNNFFISSLLSRVWCPYQQVISDRKVKRSFDRLTYRFFVFPSLSIPLLGCGCFLVAMALGGCGPAPPAAKPVCCLVAVDGADVPHCPNPKTSHHNATNAALLDRYCETGRDWALETMDAAGSLIRAQGTPQGRRPYRQSFADKDWGQDQSWIQAGPSHQYWRLIHPIRCSRGPS